MAGNKGPDRGVGHAVEGVPEDEPQQHERHSLGRRRRQSGTSGQLPRGKRGAAGDQQLSESEQADAEDLAGEQPPW